MSSQKNNKKLRGARYRIKEYRITRSQGYKVTGSQGYKVTGGQGYRVLRWDQITRVFVRKYDPIKEYGGYGYRIWFSRGVAYNVSGMTN